MVRGNTHEARRGIGTGNQVLEELLSTAPMQVKAGALAIARLAVVDMHLGQVVMRRLEADCRPLLRDPQPEDGDDPDMVYGRAWTALADGILLGAAGA
jgi:hypothetical protein